MGRCALWLGSQGVYSASLLHLWRKIDSHVGYVNIRVSSELTFHVVGHLIPFQGLWILYIFNPVQTGPEPSKRTSLIRALQSSRLLLQKPISTPTAYRVSPCTHCLRRSHLRLVHKCSPKEETPLSQDP